MAAQLLLRRIQFPNEVYPETVTFDPELMVRESTGTARPLHVARGISVAKKTKTTKVKA
jgi:hypothetical protein